MSRDFIVRSMRLIEADFARSADTHLIRLDLPQIPGIRLYLKDESAHPTGSLKHRLARSLILYGICSGWIREGRPIIEASSGSTAISEAYFARLLGLPFIAVVPASTAQRKLKDIEFYGGQCHLVEDACQVPSTAARLAKELGGHFVDQFTYAERATDWRGNNNIALSLFQQFSREEDPIPDYVVVGAGTGGTSATIGRYIRYNAAYAAKTKLLVVDPDRSAFFPAFRDGVADVEPGSCTANTVIEGVGRPRVELSFLASVIDEMMHVPDAYSIATSLWLEKVLGRKCGPSTGLNVAGALTLAMEMKREGRTGSIVTLICDDGRRYLDTIYEPTWLAGHGFNLAAAREDLGRFERGEGFGEGLERAFAP